MSAVEIAIIKQQMKDLVDNFKEMKDENLLAHKELRDMFEKAMNEKAGRWVEDAFKWGIGLVMSIVISAIVYLVIKQ